MTPRNAATLRSIEGRVFLGLVILTTLGFLWMVRGFLMPVFWAAVFAVLFRPLYRRLTDALHGRHGLAALVTTLAVILTVVIPATLLLAAVAQQALWLYGAITAGEVALQAPIDWVQRALPRLVIMLERYGLSLAQLRESVETAAVGATQLIAARAFVAGQNVLRMMLMFALMLYFLFFFIRDGDRMVAGIVRALPMGDARERRLLQKFAAVSRATVKGTLAVAAVQGALGGILFAAVGIRAALFWGVLMGVLSLLPAVGAGLVWLPAAIILIATGAVWQGLVVILGGTLVIGVVDNLLRPVLVGRAAEMPDYLVLLATLGGLSAFGLAGFIAGPIVAALFLVLWDMFAAEYSPLDDPPAPAVAVPVRGRGGVGVGGVGRVGGVGIVGGVGAVDAPQTTDGFEATSAPENTGASGHDVAPQPPPSPPRPTGERT
jgi:predicted PurR-regulated permease PerM